MATAVALVLLTNYGEYLFPPKVAALARQAKLRKDRQIDERTRAARLVKRWAQQQAAADTGAEGWTPADLDCAIQHDPAAA